MRKKRTRLTRTSTTTNAFQVFHHPKALLLPTTLLFSNSPPVGRCYVAQPHWAAPFPWPCKSWTHLRVVRWEGIPSAQAKVPMSSLPFSCPFLGITTVRSSCFLQCCFMSKNQKENQIVNQTTVSFNLPQFRKKQTIMRPL